MIDSPKPLEYLVFNLQMMLAVGTCFHYFPLIFKVTIPENVDAIHSMILDNQRTSAKTTAETLAIS
jgi:hypothetical protein